jgi:hydroxymethylpyrimidine/phosphomethylpyrimidine kinase
MNSSQMPSGEAGSVIVVVGGIDPGAGAGLGRDLLTVAALGGSVRLVGTAWTEQGPAGVRSVEPRAPDAFEAALRWALRSPGPGAVKLGMVPGPAHAEAILRALDGFAGPVVADPVLAASRGGALWDGPAQGMLDLLRRATLATPNAHEAAALTGRPVATVADAALAAAELHRAGVAAVLVKGGHLADPSGTGGDGVVTDILVSARGERRFARPRRAPGPLGASPRGTGCALASAIAVALTAGGPLDEAVATATTWLASRIDLASAADGEWRLP